MIDAMPYIAVFIAGMVVGGLVMYLLDTYRGANDDTL